MPKIFIYISARKTREAWYFFAKAQLWPRFSIEMIPELILTNKSQTRNALTALRKSHIKEIILFRDHRVLPDIMNEVNYCLLFKSLGQIAPGSLATIMSKRVDIWIKDIPDDNCCNFAPVQLVLTF